MSNITIIQSGEAVSLDPTGSGFAHGCGVFETMKLADGQLCFWEAHWARLSYSAETLGLTHDCTIDRMQEALSELVRKDSIREGTLKISLLQDGTDTRFVIYARPTTQAPDSVRLRLDKTNPLNAESALAGHKTHNYMESMLLLKSCRASGYFDVIRLNTSGFLAETTISNFFFIKNDQLYTPALHTGILPGIIREEVIKLTKQLSITVKTGDIPVEEIEGANAFFLTNSSVGILPVDQIDGDGIQFKADSTQHPVVEKLSLILAQSEQENSQILI
ncbi:aminotransferase class IV [Rubellicoccus peritrichatus]|uniref:branched-chain-amino-acid transaminase n=1 Tax=Rubellicoccus peritrichatus TaxID=3080537 RepID=A0AAQ3QTB8_9BACT|nr:aminotransferase class IV [Puniceicoccus sp. CR14]WOO41161.1 aminotransferase class IV [Puniceicoccus sp. CR14]